MNVDVSFGSNVNFNQPQPTVQEGGTGNIAVGWATPDLPQFNQPPPQSPPPPDNCFVMSHGNQSSKDSSPSQEVRQTKRRKIFTHDTNRIPLVQELLGKNIAALIKKDFVKKTDIFATIDREVHKNQY